MRPGRRRALRLTLAGAAVAVSTAVGAQLAAIGPGRSAELRTYDLRFRLRGPLPPSTAAPITILAIDSEALDTIQEPLALWHRDFARVLERLAEAGATTVGLDVLFGDVSRLDPEGQSALSRVLLQTPPERMLIALAYHVRARTVEQGADAIRMAALNGGHTLAYANLTTDPDDFVRRQEVAGRADAGEAAPSFALGLARAHAARQGRTLAEPGGNPPVVLINFRGPGLFPRVSFGAAAAAARRGDATFFREHFRDRIVLVGRVSEAGEDDLHATPEYVWPQAGGGNTARRTPGVEIHAATITTLLEGRYIRELSGGEQLAVTALLGCLIAVFGLTLGPVGALGPSVAAIAGYTAIASTLLFGRGWWFPIVAPIAGASLAGGFVQAANYFLEGRDRRRLRSIFKRYVHDRVIEAILQSPESVRLQGERRLITVLFADIRSFTTRSETQRAEELVADLNLYFEAMVAAIQENGGMVDKFIGDGIMAIFGAPVPDPEAARHAVAAARAMSAALVGVNATLAAEQRQPIAIGIGLHTGEAVIGNIGSERKLEYTAIGDVVNVAARIEGLTRKLDAEIVLSAATFEAAGEIADAEPVGDESVKGRQVAITVYRLRPGGARS